MLGSSIAGAKAVTEPYTADRTCGGCQDRVRADIDMTDDGNRDEGDGGDGEKDADNRKQPRGHQVSRTEIAGKKTPRDETAPREDGQTDKSRPLRPERLLVGQCLTERCKSHPGDPKHGHGEERAEDPLNPARYGLLETFVVFEHMDEI